MSYQIAKFDLELFKVIGMKMLSRRKHGSLTLVHGAVGQPYCAPGQNSAMHFGFVNCNQNPGGMQAEFFSDDQGRVSCLWRKTDRIFEGYPGLIHGGVLAALLDEIMANALVRRLDLFGVTIKAEFEWLRAIKVGEEVCGSAMVTARMGRLVKCEAYLTNIDQKMCARSIGIFYLPTLDQFKKLTRIDSVPTEIHRYFKS